MRLPVSGRVEMSLAVRSAIVRCLTLIHFRDVEDTEQWHAQPAFHAKRSTGERQPRGEA